MAHCNFLLKAHLYSHLFSLKKNMCLSTSRLWLLQGLQQTNTSSDKLEKSNSWVIILLIWLEGHGRLGVMKSNEDCLCVCVCGGVLLVTAWSLDNQVVTMARSAFYQLQFVHQLVHDLE